MYCSESYIVISTGAVKGVINVTMEKCPVCKNTIKTNDTVCSVCGFTDLHREFITKEDGELWVKQIVEPYKKKYGETKTNNQCSDQEYDSMGYNRAGYDKYGYNRQGYDKNGYNRRGYNYKGYDRNGYDRNGYDVRGYKTDGYDIDGYDKDGYNRQGYDKNGYDLRGFNKQGIHRNGSKFDIDGYDKNGYDKDGFNRQNIHRNGTGYNDDGYDRLGYNHYGYDRNGYDKRGFNENGVHKNGTRYDAYGCDVNGRKKQTTPTLKGDYPINNSKQNATNTGKGLGVLFAIIGVIWIILSFVLIGEFNLITVAMCFPGGMLIMPLIEELNGKNK